MRTDGRSGAGTLAQGLTAAMTPEAVVDLLEREGFGANAVVRKLLGGVDDAAVLLVGSVAEGYHSPSSDVDLLVLTYRGRDEVDLSAGTGIETGTGVELLTHTGRVEVNIDVVSRDDQDHLAETLDRVSGQMSLGGDIRRFPLLDGYKLKFLHRLRTGTVLCGQDTVDQFREDFHVHSLPLYLAVQYVFLAHESLDDALSAPHDVAGLVEYVVREVSERCLLSLAAACGFTSQSRRFVMNWLSTLPPEHVHRELFEDLRARTLTAAMVDPSQRPRLVAGAERDVARTREALSADPLQRRVIDGLFAKVYRT